MRTMTDDDLTDRNTRKQGTFEGLGLWMVGSVISLLFFSAGLEFFVRETFRQLSIATVFLALSLAYWSFVLGLGFLLVFLVWCFVKWRHGQVNYQVTSGSSSAGSPSQAGRNIPIRVNRDRHNGEWLPAFRAIQAHEDGHEARTQLEKSRAKTEWQQVGARV